MNRFAFAGALCALAACSGDRSPDFVTRSDDLSAAKVVDVSRDQTSQNETPLAINPTDPNNLITGANDWNYNDGCAVNASFDGGKTWTPTLPSGFVPGLTKYTNDPSVPGTGIYDAAGDPYVAFGPDGTAYFACQAFNFTPPFEIALYVSRSSNGGRTWQTGLPGDRPTQVSVWNGNGKSKGSNGQFPDHESMFIDVSAKSPYQGSIYIAWVQFNGNSSHSPVNVAVSRDGAATFSTPRQVTSGTVRNNQDARIVGAPDGTLYLTFDNGVQGGKGSAMYASTSADGGASWSTPQQLGTFVNPVCTFPPYCFNLSGGPFRSGGSYPAPGYDPVRDRLDVIYADIDGQYAQVYFTSASAKDLTRWTAPIAIAPAAGDRFQAEMSVAPNGRIDVSFYDRSYSANALVDMTYATSNDGGLSWTSHRVSSKGFDPSQWGVPSGTGFRPFIGDYNGMISTASSAAIAWTGVASPQPFNLEIDFASVTPRP